jgi:hypothetical protein
VEERNKRGKQAGTAAVAAAKRRGVAIINNGAGTMPLNAPAPFGGERYTLLVDDNGGKTQQRQAEPHDGTRDAEGKLKFDGYDSFRPLLSPAEAVRAGIFGGCYFNPKGGKAGIFGREVAIDPKEFPAQWFEDVNASLYVSRRYRIRQSATCNPHLRALIPSLQVQHPNK